MYPIYYLVTGTPQDVCEGGEGCAATETLEHSSAAKEGTRALFCNYRPCQFLATTYSSISSDLGEAPTFSATSPVFPWSLWGFHDVLHIFLSP